MFKCSLLICICCFFICCHNNTKQPAVSNETKIIDSGNIIILRKAIAAHPDSTSFRLKLATALDSIGAYNKALDEINLLIKKDSANYSYWFSKGMFAEHAHDTAQAINAYTTAIKIYASPDALLSIANLFAEQKNPQALRIAGRVKQMSLGKGYDAAAEFVSGVYYARTHQQQQALHFFDACITADYTYMEAYIEKGLVYFDAKQFDEALKVFRFATIVNRLYADGYYWMGRCFEMMQQKDSAIFNFKQSLGLDKTIKESHEALHRLGAE